MIVIMMLNMRMIMINMMMVMLMMMLMMAMLTVVTTHCRFGSSHGQI